MKLFTKIPLWTVGLVVLAAVAAVEAGYISYITGGNIFSAVQGEESTCQLAVAKWERENPEAAAAKEIYTGAIAPVDYANPRFPRAKNYEKPIQAAIDDGIDFNGKYAIAEWGCGTQCQEHAIVDVSNGRIVSFGMKSEAGIDMHKQYPVLISNPRQNLPNPAQMQMATIDTLTYLLNIPREYYVLDDVSATTTFKKLCTENPFEGVGI